jgi:acylphosphatase
MANIRAEVIVKGRVQGVWFRQSTCNIANKLGLTGWCRNNPDGTVSAIFEGEEEAVKTILEWCKTGPELAEVDQVQVERVRATGEFEKFYIRGN